MNTGTKIKLTRESLKLSQEELAHKVGVTQTTICNWENGKSIKHEFIPKLAETLNVSLEFFFEEKQLRNVDNSNILDNSKNTFEITIKANNHFFDDINKKFNFFIDKFNIIQQ